MHFYSKSGNISATCPFYVYDEKKSSVSTWALALEMGYKLNGSVRVILANNGIRAHAQEVEGYKWGSGSKKDWSSGAC